MGLHLSPGHRIFINIYQYLSHEKAPSGKMKRERKVREKAFT